MTKHLETTLIAGLDIGTSKTVALIGELLEDGQISVIGVGEQVSRGMDKGGVNDLDSVVQSITRALHQAEAMAECEVNSVMLSISGKHISCQNEQGMDTIDEEEVTQDNVDNVIYMARSVKMPNERKVLHVLPQEFIIDNLQDGIRNPIGMSGMRLEAKVHMITCASDMAKNITKCAQRAGLSVDDSDIVFSGLASAEAVLTEDEKALGVCLIDIGGGTTDIVVYTNGVIRHIAVVPIAGNQATTDIAKIFRTPLANAEEIKVKYACAKASLANKTQGIEVPSVGGRDARSMSVQTLAEVVEPRYTEFFELVLEELKASGFDEQIAAGIVLTGGTVKIDGVIEVAESCFGMPVRVANPNTLKGYNNLIEGPQYATAQGLLHMAAKQLLDHNSEKTKSKSFKNIFSQLQSWVKKNL
ncbi:cell division protein FtsA [Paraferrimonas sp. SM1919]|uniref:cell division protein FtsA n=1 Tax=Paraferrimonas sp. SM1919 TaxID=2662263 RepID=UPI0013D735E1|nr:cell division protein FtsA [Paraferrimonas sp. SM1919]